MIVSLLVQDELFGTNLDFEVLHQLAFRFALIRPRRAMLLRLFIGSDPRIFRDERKVKYGKDSAYTPRYNMARGSGRLPPTRALTLDNCI